MSIFCSLKLHPCGSLIAIMLIFIIIMQIRCPAGKTDYCSREVQFVLLCTGEDYLRRKNQPRKPSLNGDRSCARLHQ